MAALCTDEGRWYGGRMLAFLEGPELIVVVVVLLVLFGGTQLPKLARGLGQAQKEFKKGLEEGNEEPAPKTETTTDTKSE